MTPAEALKLIPILQAYAEGKVIQYRSDPDAPWNDPKPGETWGMIDHVDRYRIKPEPSYVPWTFETCPVGAVIREKKSAWKGVIIECDEIHAHVGGRYYQYSTLLSDMVQLDGTPCGVVAG